MVKATSVILAAMVALGGSGCAVSNPKGSKYVELQELLNTPIPAMSQPGEIIASVITDASHRIQKTTGNAVRADMFRIYVKPVVWPDGAMGMSSPALQAITVAHTIVVADPVSGLHLTYHDKQFVSSERKKASVSPF